MQAVFIELPPFERYRQAYLSDDDFRRFQHQLLQYPEQGDLISGTNGLRKIRISSRSQQKGKRGGGRVIYYHIVHRHKILLITAYNKNRQENLSVAQQQILTSLVQAILENENE